MKGGMEGTGGLGGFQLEEGSPLAVPPLQPLPFFTLDQLQEDNPWLSSLGVPSSPSRLLLLRPSRPRPPRGSPRSDWFWNKILFIYQVGNRSKDWLGAMQGLME